MFICCEVTVIKQIGPFCSAMVLLHGVARFLQNYVEKDRFS